MAVYGKYFRARIGSTIIAGATRAGIRNTADDLDATDAESNGYTDTDAGCLSLEITLAGNHIVGSAPWTALLAGATVTNLTIWLQSISGGTLTGPRWIIPSSVVLEAGDEVEVRGKITYSVRVRNKGTFSFVAS